MQLIKKTETRMLMMLLNPEQDNKDIFFIYTMCNKPKNKNKKNKSMKFIYISVYDDIIRT